MGYPEEADRTDIDNKVWPRRQATIAGRTINMVCFQIHHLGLISF